MFILTRKCTRCGKEKPLSEFGNSKKGKYGKAARCYSCEAERSKERYPSSKGRVRKWWSEHPERVKGYSQKWVENNPDKRKESYTSYRINNPNKVRVSHSKYYEGNKESEKRRNDEYRKKYPEVAVATAEKRRALKKAAPGDGISAKDIRQLKADYNGICPYCNKKKKLTLDHIVPLITGGTHDVSNAAPACPRCNSSKTDKPLLIFLLERLIDGIS